MSSLLIAHPFQCGSLPEGSSLIKLPAELLANLAMVAALVGSSGLVLFALNSAFAGY